MKIDDGWSYRLVDEQFIQVAPIKPGKDWVAKVYNINEVEIIKSS